MVIEKATAINLCYHIPGWCDDDELNFIYETTKNSDKHLEIGVFCGKSLFIAACAMKPGSQIIAVDPLTPRYYPLSSSKPQLYDTWVKDVLMLTLRAIKIRNPKIQTELIQKSSIDAFREITSQFDTIYIDGDHSYKEAKTDIQLWYTLLLEGGVIFGDDYNQTGVRDAVNESFDKFNIQNDIWVHYKPISLL